MFAQALGSACNCTDYCGCTGMMTIEEEIKALEVHRQHLKLQLEMVEKRISGLQKVGK